MTVDPCTDPRATELMAIDDSTLSALIGRFVDATRRASFASRGLAAAATETVWTGGAADAFKGSIGKMPRQLDQVLNSYYGVRAALEAYQTEIDQLKLRWTRAVAAIDQAQGPYQTASSALSADTRSLEQVLTAQARGADVSTRQVLALSADVTQATAQLRRASPAYEQACSGGMSVLVDFNTARSTLCSAIDTAAHHSITAGSFLGDPQAMATGSGSGPVRVVHHGHSGGDGGVPIAGAGGSGHGEGSTVPATVREKLARMETYVKSVMGTQYVYGGGHASFNPNGGLDCSGFVSGVLHSAGYLGSPQTTSTLPTQPGILAGHGRYVTIYDRTDCPLGDQHVIIDINGQFYEEGGISSGGAPDVHRFTPSPEYLASFNQILHPTGM
jgi:cell wall-associated NlpC family hydrolase